MASALPDAAGLTAHLKNLARRRGAIILAHNYQIPEVQDAADFIGDSLELSRKAAELEENIIVFCGVHFMAETAFILSPQKIVLLPELGAGCPMADMITADDLSALKEKYPDAAVVCYVNSTAGVKALSDICCTSANAVKVVQSLDAERILFVPDKGLGAYVASKVQKEIILVEGYCPTHYLRITKQDILEQKKSHPEAVVIVHPECSPETISAADEAASTAGILRFAVESDAREIIVGTELGMLHRLRKQAPDKIFYPASQTAVCPNMKKINLKKVIISLEKDIYKITLPEDIRQAAHRAVARMLEIK